MTRVRRPSTPAAPVIVLGVGAVYVTLVLAFWIAIGVIAIHFITKAW